MIEATSPRDVRASTSDDDLVAQARAGDEHAFAVLYRRHAADARREARRRTSIAPDDIVSVAFASVFRAMLRGGGPDRSFRAYLMTAVRNAAIDAARSPSSIEQPTEHVDVEVAAMSDDDDRLNETMGAAFVTLSHRQRAALWQTEVEGRSSAEMARMLRISDNAFAALKTRARRNLADAFAREVAGGDTCRWVSRRADPAGGDVDGETMTYAERLVVQSHLRSCPACGRVAAEETATARMPYALLLLLAAPAIRRRGGRWAFGRASAAHGPVGAAVAAVTLAGVATVAVVAFVLHASSGSPSDGGGIRPDVAARTAPAPGPTNLVDASINAVDAADDRRVGWPWTGADVAPVTTAVPASSAPIDPALAPAAADVPPPDDAVGGAARTTTAVAAAPATPVLGASPGAPAAAPASSGVGTGPVADAGQPAPPTPDPAPPATETVDTPTTPTTATPLAESPPVPVSPATTLAPAPVPGIGGTLIAAPTTSTVAPGGVVAAPIATTTTPPAPLHVVVASPTTTVSLVVVIGP